MKNISNYCLILLVIFLIAGCKEEEIIVPKVDEIVSDRIVLIEDFTGVKCPNCPNASREISSLIGRYPKNIVAVAYHTDFLGSPITTPVEFKSKYDFRTTEAETLENDMGSYLGKPAVSLNRKLHNAQEEYLLTSSSVLGNIDNELRSIPKAKIHIENLYDATSRKLVCNIEIEPVSSSTGDFRLHALINESNIIDSQEDNPIDYVKDYKHNHVFRKMLSALAGDPLATALTPGTIIKKTYEFTLPPEAGWWVAENCNVVAFISDLNMKTYSVGAIVQAAEAHVLE